MSNTKQLKATDNIGVISSVIETMPHAAWITEGNQKVVTANSTACELERLGCDLLKPNDPDSKIENVVMENLVHTVIPLNHGTNLMLHQIRGESPATRRLRAATQRLDEALQASAV